MKNTTENRKIILGHNGIKGYEIKNVMSSEVNIKYTQNKWLGRGGQISTDLSNVTPTV